MEIGEKFLPVGSVAMLAGGSKRVVVIGYCPKTEEGTMYDYAGALYPEGVLDPNKTLLFNHDQIAQVFYKGLVDEEQTAFMTKLNDVVNKLNSGETIEQIAAGNEAPAEVPAPVVPEVAPMDAAPAPMPEAAPAPVAPEVAPMPEIAPAPMEAPAPMPEAAPMPAPAPVEMASPAPIEAPGLAPVTPIAPAPAPEAAPAPVAPMAPTGVIPGEM